MKPNNKGPSPLSRRDFIVGATAGAAGLFFPWQQLGAEIPAPNSLVLIKGGNAEKALLAAFQALDVAGKLPVKNSMVVIKPNIGWDRTPEQAANTDPNLIAAVVNLFKAGKNTVQLFDSTCNSAQRCYRRSGIEAAAKSAGAEVSFIHEKRFDEVELPQGERIKSWLIYRDYLRADLRVNVPILKHHSLAGLTMGLKNLMGVMGGERSTIHNGFKQKLIDIAMPILPELTILDARRVLMRNGPQGGNLEDVKIVDALIAGYDPVAVDAEGARLLGSNPRDLDYLVEAERRGLGRIDRPDGYLEISLGA